MKTFLIFFICILINFNLFAQTAQNVQLLDVKLGSEIYTTPPIWNPNDPDNPDRFCGGWGYLKQSTGNKYYYSGDRRGFVAYNVTDPNNIQVSSVISDPEGVTHIKIYEGNNGDYLYTTPGADPKNDLVIYDISDYPNNPIFVNTIPVGGSSDIKYVHDIFIEEGVLYISCLSNEGDPGLGVNQLFIYDLRTTPENPERIGNWEIPEHVPFDENIKFYDGQKGNIAGIVEVYVKDDRIYMACGSAGIIIATFYDTMIGNNLHRIIDENNTWVIDYRNLRRLAANPNFPDFKVTHTVKATDDHNYIFVTDENLPKGYDPFLPNNNQGGVLRLFDISNITSFTPISDPPPYQYLEPIQIYEAPESMDEGRIVSTNDELIEFNDPLNSIHKFFLQGDFAYVSYYTKGLRIIDISDIENWKEAAYYDTPGSWNTQTHGMFSGAWEVFPFWGNDQIIVPNYDGTMTFKFGSSSQSSKNPAQ